MADISKIKTGSNTYDVKDSTARSGLNNKVDKNGTDSLMSADEHTKLAGMVSGASDYIYDGVDLSDKFSDEIQASPYNGNRWAWIQTRIANGNYEGIHVADYIPFTCEDNKGTFKAQIAGIDTYVDSTIAHSIDFISVELWATAHAINKVKYNNGLPNLNSSGEPDGTSGITKYSLPWLNCDLYYYLNSEAGYVLNDASRPITADKIIGVDYTEGGVYYYLPDELKAVISPKFARLPARYSSTAILDSNNDWKNLIEMTPPPPNGMGKLWLPNEYEVYGTAIWSEPTYSIGDSVQYPLFVANRNARMKKKLNSSGYNRWWLSTPAGKIINSAITTGNWCEMANTNPNCNAADLTGRYVPICFRIAATNA